MIQAPVQRSEGAVRLYPAAGGVIPEKRVGGRIWADLPVLPHLRGGRPAPLWAAEGGEYPAGVAVCGAGGNTETGLWKTQPHLPKIL